MRICVWGDCIHRFFLLCVGVDVGIDPYGPDKDIGGILLNELIDGLTEAV